jgi:hypothetical protein
MYETYVDLYRYGLHNTQLNEEGGYTIPINLSEHLRVDENQLIRLENYSVDVYVPVVPISLTMTSTFIIEDKETVETNLSSIEDIHLFKSGDLRVLHNYSNSVNPVSPNLIENGEFIFSPYKQSMGLVLEIIAIELKTKKQVQIEEIPVFPEESSITIKYTITNYN